MVIHLAGRDGSGGGEADRTTEAEILGWVAGWEIAPDMNVRAFVDQARTLGQDAERVLLGLLRDRAGTGDPAVIAALRARGRDVFVPSPGRVGMSLTGTEPGGRTTEPQPSLTYAQLAAPISDRPNHKLFPPRAVFATGCRTSYRDSRDRSQRQARARAALGAAAVGLGADRVDDLIDDIWTTEGLPPPPAHIRPMLVDRATQKTNRLDDLRTTVDIVQGYARWGSRIVRLIRQKGRYRPGRPEDRKPGIHVRTGSQSVEVQLDADAQPRLADLGDEAHFVSDAYATISVELRLGADGCVEVWKTSRLQRATHARFGVVSAGDAEPYRDDLTAAVAAGRQLRSGAIRTQGPGRTWRLFLFLPADGA